jgi:putative ATPase
MILREQNESEFDDSLERRSFLADFRYTPLATKMRQKALSEIVGQEHIQRERCLLSKLRKSGTFSSIILHQVLGCRKITLVEVIANETKSKFVEVNAVLSNIAELHDVLFFAIKHYEQNILSFIDEIHCFNNTQRDLLLRDVEDVKIRLIGATTHNPGFYAIPPLLSRSHLFKLNPVSIDAISRIFKRALSDGEHGLGPLVANGDMRWALSALETLVTSLPIGSEIEAKDVENFSMKRALGYDADADEHSDTYSA